MWFTTLGQFSKVRTTKNPPKRLLSDFKRFSGEVTMNKFVFNLSNYQITSFLYGTEFCIPPVSVKWDVIFSEFEEFIFLSPLGYFLFQQIN